MNDNKVWEYELPLGNARYVCQRDKFEVGTKVMKWNGETQDRILGEINRTNPNYRPWTAGLHSVPLEAEDDTSSDSI